MRCLHHFALHPCSRKLRLLLREKSLDFALETENYWERRPAFLKLNPSGEVPVLVEEDGAIVAYRGYRDLNLAAATLGLILVVAVLLTSVSRKARTTPSAAASTPCPTTATSSRSTARPSRTGCPGISTTATTTS